MTENNGAPTWPPAPDFDPLTASSAELMEHDLPTRPDQDSFPNLLKFWEKMFSPPLNFIPNVEFFASSAALTATVRRQRSNRIGGSRRQSSLNWSGSYIKPRDGKVFTEVHGSWVVPTVAQSVPPAISFEDRDYSCSTWIGLDGQRSYIHSSLPQIGTSQVIEKDLNGEWLEPRYFAWWQWWDRIGDENGRPQDFKTIAGLTVSPGHEIMCSLRVFEESEVKFIIKNQNTGDLVRLPIKQAPIGRKIDENKVNFRVSGTKDVNFRVSGATAEWVTERPSEWLEFLSEDRQLNFPNYSAVGFCDCIAVQTEPSGFGREERNLLGARLIDMREVRQNPARTAKISITNDPTPLAEPAPVDDPALPAEPVPDDRHSFRTTYRASEQ